MKNYFKYIVCLALFLAFAGSQPLMASPENQQAEGDVDVKELILDHLADTYEWHIVSVSEKHISIPLPIIVIGQNGFDVFMSAKFNHGHDAYNGYYIAQSGDYRGKIVEKNASGEEIRPWDFSLTRNAFSLIIASVLLIIIIMKTAKWHKNQLKTGVYTAPKGFVGLMEMFIMSVVEDIIRPCVGKNYKKFAPYLLTVFFFIFINNVLGLIPLFPGGANVTGNIAVTLVLAVATFLVVNLTGTKEYAKEIFWPDVPGWLKPLMIPIEIVSVFTKPFALMIRLFANILAGHSIVLGLTCLIFVTVKLGPAINTSMSIVSIVLTVFISFVEILVAYIQAYVFTMLSAVFIGLAQAKPHHQTENVENK